MHSDDANALNKVRARIAAAVLPGTPTGESATKLGRFQLRDDQLRGRRQIVDCLGRFGGALLADRPGAGKTVTALASAEVWLRTIARAEPRCLVIAPATLRAQWLRSAGDAGVRIEFLSLESLSRGVPTGSAAMVIVDEAHRCANPLSRRYRALAELAQRAPVLLLSATPVVNRIAERDALLSLFLGHRALTEDLLAATVLRRVGSEMMRPSVRWLRAMRVPDPDAGIARALRELPAPLPFSDGRAARAIIQTSLAFAWQSSLAALDHALRRRLARGEALLAELEVGRWPSRAALRDWLIGDDAAQLSLPLLATSSPPAGALDTMRAHLDAVRALRDRVAPLVAADTFARANAVRQLLSDRSDARIVLFAHHATTVRALWSALRFEPGVVAITGDNVRAAAGRWTRDEVLAAFSSGGAYRADDPRGVRLLLATDLLAEGVELPGAAVVVHGDVPWTPARLEQRVGRARRPGNVNACVQVTRFRAPRGVQTLLRLSARLRDKRSARSQSTQASETAERVHALVREWSAAVRTDASIAGCVTAAVGSSARTGFVAVLRREGGTVLLVAERHAARWRVSTSPRALLRALTRANGDATVASPTLAAEARQLARRFAERQKSASAAPTLSPAANRLARALNRRVDRALRSASISDRGALAEIASDVVQRFRSSAGAGAQLALRASLREPHDANWLRRLHDLSREWRDPQTTKAADASVGDPVALLLFQPLDASAIDRPTPASAAPSPPSAWTESAATR